MQPMPFGFFRDRSPVCGLFQVFGGRHAQGLHTFAAVLGKRAHFGIRAPDCRLGSLLTEAGL